MRTFRTARTARTSGPHARLLAAAGVTLAALALTACNDGTGVRDEGASTPASPTASAPAADGSASADTGAPSGGPARQDARTAGGSSAGKATGASASTGTGTGGAGSSPGAGKAPSAGGGDASDPYAPENHVICNGSNTAVTARKVSRPVNHMLLTVRNTGSKVCDLTYYPVLRFDEMQWAPQPFAESRPQAVTSLAPGESGYAGVLLSAADGSGDGGGTGHRLTVRFHGATPNSDGGAVATPSLPAGGVYYDSSLRVTYWRSSMDDALAY
ncbi:hypothetical protein SUDANB6_02601 [Streptomyces sp. enrichment culture]|uniref:DUF4232 domain-containing protein n=1 Tax=Streptomyces sp. enrichment culture TaxID=1795815 RepID=UPI003F564E30